MSAFDPFDCPHPLVPEVNILISATDLGVVAHIDFKIHADGKVLESRNDDLWPDMTPAERNHVKKLAEDMLARARSLLPPTLP